MCFSQLLFPDLRFFFFFFLVVKVFLEELTLDGKEKKAQSIATLENEPGAGRKAAPGKHSEGSSTGSLPSLARPNGRGEDQGTGTHAQDSPASAPDSPGSAAEQAARTRCDHCLDKRDPYVVGFPGRGTKASLKGAKRRPATDKLCDLKQVA